MVDVDKMSDAELRNKLLEFGFPLMPITGTTRKVMVKKLKLLLENQNKIDKSESGRRSLGRYSSEEESDAEVNVVKKKENRRATMAAPVMQPPSVSVKLRKHTIANNADSGTDVSKSPKKTEYKSTLTTTTNTRTSKILKNAQDEFDTGSDSESDIVTNTYTSRIPSSTTYSKYTPIRTSLSPSYTLNNDSYSTPELETSYVSSTRNLSYTNPTTLRASSFHSPSLASEYASDKLDQIRNRFRHSTSEHDQLYSAPTLEKEETPFLSNFTKRISASLQSSQRADLDYKNDIIKEHDTNGSSLYARSHLSSLRSMKGRDNSYSYKSNQSNILKNNFVSFAVLAGAALFFICLAIVYLGLKSDTSVMPFGTIIPHCSDDPSSKRGINCIESEDEVITAIHLLNVIKPELQKRSVTHICYDPAMKQHMTDTEIVNFVRTNYALKDDKKIRSDLLNLEILIFNNPEWGIKVVQADDNNGQINEENIVENMEKVIFNYGQKITSLVIFNPDLPWKCSFYNSSLKVAKVALFLGIFVGLIYALNIGYKYYKHNVQKEKNEVGFMVEKIIDILQSSVGEDNEDKFVVINHVRDMILPVADRKKKQSSWQKAVKIINENESRVRTEVQTVQGEPFEVWRWIGSANLSATGSPRNKSWQGQAFETQVGSVNSLPCSPTPCLKIRGMIEDGDSNTHIIREAILGKCAHQCRILHCAVDTNSNCVYLKCADPSDAAIAYQNLHGWWYASHLVTVKYIRLERYMQRFPDSPASGPPYLKAIAPSTDWSS